MYIKKQKFTDEETLIEQLFDFGIGEPSAYVQDIMLHIRQELVQAEEFKKELAKIKDEEEVLEYEDDVIRANLAAFLLQHFECFEVDHKSLFALNQNDHQLLYTITLSE